jgi:hypothetical protein
MSPLFEFMLLAALVCGIAIGLIIYEEFFK